MNTDQQQLTDLETQQIREDFYEQSVPFKYSEVEAEDIDEMDPDEAALRAITETLQWFVGFLFHSRENDKPKKPSTAYKRLLAYVYVLRPDLIEGQTLQELMTSELAQSRNALSKWTAELSYMFGLQGKNQKVFRARLAYRLAQLKTFDEKTRDDLPRNAGELSEWMKSSTFSRRSSKMPATSPANSSPSDTPPHGVTHEHTDSDV